MNFKPYKEILAMTKEKIDEMMAPLRAAKIRKKVEMRIIECEMKMTTLEQEANAMLTKEDPDIDAVIKKWNDYGFAEREFKQMKQLLDMLFPADQ